MLANEAALSLAHTRITCPRKTLAALSVGALFSHNVFVQASHTHSLSLSLARRSLRICAISMRFKIKGRSNAQTNQIERTILRTKAMAAMLRIRIYASHTRLRNVVTLGLSCKYPGHASLDAGLCSQQAARPRLVPLSKAPRCR